MKLLKKKVIYRLGEASKDGFSFGTEDAKPYLIRWNIFQCRFFSIKLHRILMSDDDCMHDHPWTFISFILKGGYVEQTPSGKKLFGAGSLLFRPADFIHRLEIFQPATTLVINFKKNRMWGFHTKEGFVPWFKYSSKNRC